MRHRHKFVVSAGSLGLLALWHSWLGTSNVPWRHEVDEDVAEEGGQLPA